ncbi:hypothetical protein I350_00224 [Cryptococcus amylolentus CBS 6273]|uniref:Uncharacterized protein n=1 Tax=Cryptococcus amylolentus CBS 6273 TaxID=1296118 RepID=A0A1E3KEB2_9TREE|nr:hypothetical protein I350_00224 [Cryptococcus amylolentus CBS 6273]
MSDGQSQPDEDCSWAENIVDLTAAPEIEYQGSQPGEAASKPSTTVPQSLPENDSVKGDLQSIVDDEGERN